MLTVLTICFAAALAAPWLHRRWPDKTAPVLAGATGLVFAWFVWHVRGVMHGAFPASALPWIPALDLTLAFRLDGLSLLFALLISGIGALILLYTGGYLKGDPRQGRFLAFITAFMSSMLGVVLADHVIVLFVFWELTSFTSYLLIGFDHEKEESRAAALQALLVTGLGGLCLLAGLILAAGAADTWLLSEMLSSGGALRAHPYYPAILTLIALGAFTKSAQVPFHFWLPNAMQAPTPASAFLHSSTMVKAGVYLLARLNPALGGTPEWAGLLTVIGAATFLTGALMASGQHVLKRLLAYSTVSALGAMVMLLGVGSSAAVKAMAAFILAHAIYKAALFMVAGALTHETGETSVDRLSGLRGTMPVTAACALVAALSMGGFPPLFGFVAKETWVAALGGRFLLVLATMIGGALFVVVGLAVGWKPFRGEPVEECVHVHEAPRFMLAGPAALAGGSILLALFAGWTGHVFVEPAATATAGAPVEVHLHLWPGFNLALLISLVTLAAGLVLYRVRPRLLALAGGWGRVAAFGPDAWYRHTLKGVMAFADVQTRCLQTGYLRHYIRYIVVTATLLAAVAFVRGGGIDWPSRLSPVSLPVILVAVLMMAAAAATVHSRSRLQSILSLGVVGYGMALLFTLFGAPDLAMTQLVIETLTVILLVLAFYHLPPFRLRSPARICLVDAAVAVSAGLMVTLLVLAALQADPPTPVADFYLANSLEAAHGRNVVNVILVDFRALDTLGEITVLTLAALGAVALLKLRPQDKEGAS